jgi:hypothetical protein
MLLATVRALSVRVVEKGVQANAFSHTYDVKLELSNQLVSKLLPWHGVQGDR